MSVIQRNVMAGMVAARVPSMKPKKKVTILKIILSSTGSQWNVFSNGLACLARLLLSVLAKKEEKKKKKGQGSEGVNNGTWLSACGIFNLCTDDVADDVAGVCT